MRFSTTRHVPMPRPVGRVAKRLRRVRVGFRYHDTLGHGRPLGMQVARDLVWSPYELATL